MCVILRCNEWKWNVPLFSAPPCRFGQICLLWWDWTACSCQTTSTCWCQVKCGCVTGVRDEWLGCDKPRWSWHWNCRQYCQCQRCVRWRHWWQRRSILDCTTDLPWQQGPSLSISCLSVCLSVCPSLCLFVSLYVLSSVCSSVFSSFVWVHLWTLSSPKWSVNSDIRLWVTRSDVWPVMTTLWEHECDTSVTQVWHEYDVSVTQMRHRCDTSVTQVWHECDRCDTSVTQLWHKCDTSVTWVWHRCDTSVMRLITFLLGYQLVDIAAFRWRHMEVNWRIQFGLKFHEIHQLKELSKLTSGLRFVFLSLYLSVCVCVCEGVCVWGTAL